MKKTKIILAPLLLAILGMAIFGQNSINTLAADPQKAAKDVIGQVDLAGLPLWSQSGEYNSEGIGPNERGFSLPDAVRIDTTNHRLFVVEGDSNRVLVFNLDANNNLIDKSADYVLGQPDFTTLNPGSTTASTFDKPRSLAIDTSSNRIFVMDQGNNRILIFDTTTIVNNEPAIYVLGQPNFTSVIYSGASSNNFSTAEGLDFDTSSNRLFVADTYNNRILIFDTTTIVNNEPAIYVLGQPNFNTDASALTQSGVYWPRTVSYDGVHSRLFVADTYNCRVLVFSLNGLSNGMNASHVLGAPDFVSNPGCSGATSRELVAYLSEVSYDSTTNRLIVVGQSSNRVIGFDLDNISTYMDASFVLGQSDFTKWGMHTDRYGLNFPSSVAIDEPNQRIWIADTNNNRIVSYEIAVTFSPTSLGSGVVGSTYSETISTLTDFGEVTFGLDSGNLPNGLTLGVNGVISGTPTSAGTYNFQVKAINSYGAAGEVSAIKPYVVTVKNKPAAATQQPQSSAQQTQTTSGSTAQATIDLETQFSTESSVDVLAAPTQVLTFNLPSTTTSTDGDEQHTITINSIGSDYADITVASEPIKFRLLVGQTNLVDVDRNGSNDVSITLISVVGGKAKLNVKKLSTTTSNQAAAAQTVPSSDAVNGVVATVISPRANALTKYIILNLFLLVALLLGLVALIRRKSRSQKQIL